MRSLFVLTVLLFTSIVTFADDVQSTEVDFNKLCLKMNRISIDGVEITNPQMKWAQTEGIFYAYNPSDSRNTFKSLIFPILAEKSTSKKTDESNSDTPIIFTFKGDESIVGCWLAPNFELNIRFKLYEFHHIALKAVSNISIPLIQESKQGNIGKSTVTLHTLPYKYEDAIVNVDIAFEWSYKKIKLAAAPPISPIGPPMVPGTPPISMNAEFDSDELTNDIIAAKAAVYQGKNDEDILSPSDMNNNNQGTDWMFVAALCSSILGLFILIYICISAYRRHGYETIPNEDKLTSKMGNSRKIPRISLRDITKGINSINEERKGINNKIMHPSSSYTY